MLFSLKNLIKNNRFKIKTNLNNKKLNAIINMKSKSNLLIVKDNMIIMKNKLIILIDTIKNNNNVNLVKSIHNLSKNNSVIIMKRNANLTIVKDNMIIMKNKFHLIIDKEKNQIIKKFVQEHIKRQLNLKTNNSNIKIELTPLLNKILDNQSQNK